MRSIERGSNGLSNTSTAPLWRTSDTGAPPPDAMDKDEVRYIVVCLFAVPLIFWLLGPFMGMAALIVFAALFFVWREPDAPNRIPLLWEDHFEQPGRVDKA